MFDNIDYFTINSGLEEYVCYSEDEFVEKIKYFSTHLDELKDLKKEDDDKQQPQNVTNALFVGSTAELQKMISGRNDDV